MTISTSAPTDVVEAIPADGQFVRIGPDNGLVELDLDPSFTDVIQDAYLSILVRVPSSAQAGIDAAAGLSLPFIQSDEFAIYIEKVGSDYYWTANGDNLALVEFDEWVSIEWHAIGGDTTTDIWIDGVPTSTIGVTPPPGINFISASYLLDPGSYPDDSVDVDELSYAFDGRVSIVGPYALWAFETADPINEAIANFPDPPFTVADDASLSIEDGGGDEPVDIPPGEAPPALAPPIDPAVSVYMDGVDVTSCVQTGSVTRRLNRPWTATLRMFTFCAPGDACSRVKIVINNVLWIHGFVTQISTEAGEDGNLMSEYTIQDPMFLWQWRPARSGPASSDPGDFSNPKLFKDPSVFGPDILEQILLQSETSVAHPLDPYYTEGPLFLEFGGFAAGVKDLSGAPTDYPMTIAEVFELLSSTGTVDAVLTPIDSGGNMALIDVYNGDYGTDRTGSIAFEYATGAHNVKGLRMTEDSSNMVNKLWYYLGPRVKTPIDPAGDQHWRANVTGQDLQLPYPPGGASIGALGDYVGNDGTNDLGERIYNSRISNCGVRMEVRIYDAQGDENPAEFRELYRRLWQMESWLRAIPRVLVHVTPVRTSDAMQLPPGVTPVQVGDFDIGDLVTVTAGTVVRGGFSGAQRVYEYTVTWDEDGVLDIGELLTSSDQEGML